MIKPDYTPSERFEALAYFFGQQGGTCHQIDDATGCKNSLTRPLAKQGTEEWIENYAARDSHCDSELGWFSVRTCTKDYRINILAPAFRGIWAYWTSVIEGYWATGALGGNDFSQRFGNESR